MKIVHLCLTGGYTEGINYQENYLTKYQSLDGHDVLIITTEYCWHKNIWGECKETNYYNKYGTYVIRLPYKYNIPYKLNTYIGKFIGLFNKLEEFKPDVIFIHNLQFWDLKEVKRYKEIYQDTKIYVDNHSDFSNSARNWVSKNILYGLYWKKCAKLIEMYTTKFYGVLPARVDFLKNVFGIKPEKCELLVMGADDESVTRVANGEVRRSFRLKYGIEESDFLIVTGGKIDSFKTQTLFLMKAIKNINNPHLKLCIFGSIEQGLQQQVDALCDNHLIQYIGWAKGNQSYDFFSAADLVVFPGRHSVYWEEVGGIGIPMVCKYWEGTTHIDCGGNVIFLKEDTTEEIQRVLEDIINSPEQYKKMLNIAREKGKNIFSYKKIARKSIEL